MDVKAKYSPLVVAILILMGLAAVIHSVNSSPIISAQLIQPKWNWEEVILSRNGPSTTQAPTTTTQYTTLRSVVGENVKPVKGVGTASIENAHLVPRHQKSGRKYSDPYSSFG